MFDTKLEEIQPAHPAKWDDLNQKHMGSLEYIDILKTESYTCIINASVPTLLWCRDEMKKVDDK
jgi:hypothetical protein